MDIGKLKARLTLQSQSFAQRDSNLLLLGWRDPGEKRKGEGARSDQFGDREMVVGGNSSAPRRLLVDRYEVSGGGNAVPGKDRLDTRAVGGFGEADDEDEPADGAVRLGQRRQLKGRKVCEKNMVAFGGRAAKGQDFGDTAELHATECAGDIGKTVVESAVGVMEPVGCGLD